MAPYVASWGIIGCGWISTQFCKELAMTRPEITDVAHHVAVVGARDASKAKEFIQTYLPSGGSGQTEKAPEAVGDYESVYTHPDVKVVYIGTLNPTHYPLAIKVLEAGKSVLIEKPACLTAAQWVKLSALAAEKQLFLMEGMWTRFLPLYSVLKSKLHDEKVIGDIKSVRSDFSMAFYNNHPDTHRTLALEQAGGPLFDLGGYAILPAILALYENPDNKGAAPESLVTSMQLARTGVDLTSTVALTFPNIGASALCTASFGYNSPRDERCIITGTKGEIVLNDGLSRITKMTIKVVEEGPAFRPTKWREDEVIEKPFEAFGLGFEAAAVARSLRDGELQNPTMTHKDTEFILSMFDKVREQGGYKLPSNLTEA